MSERRNERGKALIFRVDSRLCAVQIGSVIETMRPLPIEQIAGAPEFVKGVAVIRGKATPVIDVAAILGMPPGTAAARFVTVRAGGKQVALAVNAVVGIREIGEAVEMEGLPPLLQEAANDVVETIGRLDEQFLMVLKAAWELPEDIWNVLSAAEVVL